ncbi:dehydrogenase/reductase SDR family member on chromosome X-like isoform X2 [Coregonus clupeaformis]|uniref:dehydrogenase/reductase SDR family member on chromosome X-like isoform X2 n=1 Tax=Coregonus clupeaformis TaxID=59861 RepID=UPI001BDF96DA|nr:dehydrogenase/reductase SDR family member on chromosome X-like isoform X2 [Coregonus clupeaformis]
MKELPRQHGIVAIVTGDTRGICFETTRHMASLGAHIIIAGQHEWEGVSAVKRICEENREAKVEFEQLDLVSLQSVRQFIQTFKRRGLLLHILVNNEPVPGSVHGPLHCSVSISGVGERRLLEQWTHRYNLNKHLQPPAPARPLGLQL